MEVTSVFISYASNDADWLRKVLLVLYPLERDGEIVVWTDTRIAAGKDWRVETQEALETARIAILILSPDFLASDFIHKIEIPALLEASRERGLTILQLVVRPIPLDFHPDLSRLQTVNRPNDPLSGMSVTAQEQCLVRLRESILQFGLVASSVEVTGEPLMVAAGGLPRAPVSTVKWTVPQPDGERYNRAWYVERGQAEKRALDYLANAGRPACIWGPGRFGKTWFIHHVTSSLAAEIFGPRVARINLLRLPKSERETYERLLHFVALNVASAFGLDIEEFEKEWRLSYREPHDRFWRFLWKLLAASSSVRLLAIDNADILVETGYGDDFFGLLRATAEDVSEEFGRLRLILAFSINPYRATTSLNHSPFYNLSAPILLPELDAQQVTELARRYGLSWSTQDILDLTSFVGGHPYLVRVAMYESARHGANIPDLLSSARVPQFESHLRELRKTIAQQPSLHAALSAVGASGTDKLGPDEFDALRRLALVVREDGRYRLRCRMYEELISR